MNNEKKLRYSKWECEICNDTFVTDSKARWDMIWCKCGKSAVDDEEWYTRFIGNVKPLTQSNNLEEINKNN